MPTATEQKKTAKPTLADAAIVSQLKDLGWKALKQTDGSGYVAHEIKGDRKVGPATSLKALQTQVNLASGPPVDKSKNGNGHKPGTMAAATADRLMEEQRLPTMEEPEIDELNRIADRCLNAKEAKEKSEAAFKDECDVMREKMREYGRKRYKRHGYPFVIEESEKLHIKKPENEKPLNPSTKRGVQVKKGNGAS